MSTQTYHFFAAAMSMFMMASILMNGMMMRGYGLVRVAKYRA